MNFITIMTFIHISRSKVMYHVYHMNGNTFLKKSGVYYILKLSVRDSSK